MAEDTEDNILRRCYKQPMVVLTRIDSNFVQKPAKPATFKKIVDLSTSKYRKNVSEVPKERATLKRPLQLDCTNSSHSSPQKKTKSDSNLSSGCVSLELNHSNIPVSRVSCSSPEKFLPLQCNSSNNSSCDNSLKASEAKSSSPKKLLLKDILPRPSKNLKISRQKLKTKPSPPKACDNNSLKVFEAEFSSPEKSLKDTLPKGSKSLKSTKTKLKAQLLPKMQLNLVCDNSSKVLPIQSSSENLLNDTSPKSSSNYSSLTSNNNLNNSTLKVSKTKPFKKQSNSILPDDSLKAAERNCSDFGADRHICLPPAKKRCRVPSKVKVHCDVTEDKCSSPSSAEKRVPPSTLSKSHTSPGLHSCKSKGQCEDTSTKSSKKESAPQKLQNESDDSENVILTNCTGGDSVNKKNNSTETEFVLSESLDFEPDPEAQSVPTNTDLCASSYFTSSGKHLVDVQEPSALSVFQDETGDHDSDELEIQCDMSLSLLTSPHRDILSDDSESEDDEHSYKRRPSGNQNPVNDLCQTNACFSESSEHRRTLTTKEPPPVCQSRKEASTTKEPPLVCLSRKEALTTKEPPPVCQSRKGATSSNTRTNNDRNMCRKQSFAPAFKEQSNYRIPRSKAADLPSWRKRPSHKVVRDYCYNYQRYGMCAKICRFIHCFPEGKEEFFPTFQKFCKNGWINSAFTIMHQNIMNVTPSVLADILLNFLEACVAAKQESFLKCLIDFIKHEILTTSFCSKFIIMCKKEPDISFSAYLHVFSLCEKKKIPLSEKASLALLYMFESRGKDYSRVLSAMIHIRLVCKQAIPASIFEKVLAAVNKIRSVDLVEKMQSLMLTVDEEYLTGIESSQVQIFKEHVKKVNSHFFIENRDVEQPLDQFLNVEEKPPTEQIRNYVAQGRWIKVAEIFQDFVTRGKGGTITEEIHAAIFCHGELLGDKYTKFIRELGGGTKEITLHKKMLLAQLGVALMLEAHDMGYMKAAFEILQAMHCCGINYMEVQRPVIPEEWNAKCAVKVCVTSSWVALVAADICVHVQELADALQVLKDTSWATPSDKLDSAIRTHELSFRVRLLMKMSAILLEENVELGVEAMDVLLTSVISDFKTPILSAIVTDIDELYTSYMVKLLNERKPDHCVTFYKHFNNLYPRLRLKPIILRSLITLWFPSHFQKSEELFDQALLRGVYSFELPSQLASLHVLKLHTYLTKAEFSMIISVYLDTVFRLVEKTEPISPFKVCPEICLVFQEENCPETEPYICHVHELNNDLLHARKRACAALQKLYGNCSSTSTYTKDIIHFSHNTVSDMFLKWIEKKKGNSNGSRAGSCFERSGSQSSTNFFMDNSIPSSKQVMSFGRYMPTPFQHTNLKLLTPSSSDQVSNFSSVSSERDVHGPLQHMHTKSATSPSSHQASRSSSLSSDRSIREPFHCTDQKLLTPPSSHRASRSSSLSSDRSTHVPLQCAEPPSSHKVSHSSSLSSDRRMPATFQSTEQKCPTQPPSHQVNHSSLLSDRSTCEPFPDRLSPTPPSSHQFSHSSSLSSDRDIHTPFHHGAPELPTPLSSHRVGCSQLPSILGDGQLSESLVPPDNESSESSSPEFSESSSSNDFPDTDDSVTSQPLSLQDCLDAEEYIPSIPTHVDSPNIESHSPKSNSSYQLQVRGFQPSCSSTPENNFSVVSPTCAHGQEEEEEDYSATKDCDVPSSLSSDDFTEEGKNCAKNTVEHNFPLKKCESAFSGSSDARVPKLKSPSVPSRSSKFSESSVRNLANLDKETKTPKPSQNVVSARVRESNCLVPFNHSSGIENTESALESHVLYQEIFQFLKRKLALKHKLPDEELDSKADNLCCLFLESGEIEIDQTTKKLCKKDMNKLWKFSQRHI